MSGNSLLVDTNIVLYLLSGDKTLASFLKGKKLYVSFITQLEILGYEGIKKSDLRKIELFLNDCTIIDIQSDIKNKVIEIRKIGKIKLPDAIIAATSSYLGIPLISSDKGFEKISSLDLILYQP
jgi:predicted nucleic acid-binding protein